MEIAIYGMNICPDCAEALEELDKRKIDYIYKDFSKDTKNLKEFLKFRDTKDLFEQKRISGEIGIPCFELPDGSLTLSLDDVYKFLDKEGERDGEYI